MKKLIIASFSLLLAAATTQAQTSYTALKTNIKKDKQEQAASKKEKREERKELRKLEGKEVTYQSKEHFEQDFPSAKEVTWKRTDYFDEATFTQDGKNMRAFYDNQSDLVGSSTTMKLEDLPADAQKYIQKKYSDYTVDEVFLFDDNEYNQTDMILYGHQFEDADNYFVGLEKDGKMTVLQVNPGGQVSDFFVKQ